MASRSPPNYLSNFASRAIPLETPLSERHDLHPSVSDEDESGDSDGSAMPFIQPSLPTDEDPPISPTKSARECLPTMLSMDPFWPDLPGQEPTPLWELSPGSPDAPSPGELAENATPYHNPTLPQILDTLQVAMMTMSRGDVHEPLPVEFNALVSCLIEAFPAMQRKVALAEHRLERAVAAREEDLLEYQSVSQDWVERENEFKGEIRRLEKLLARESKDGMEAVAVARSNTVVNRKDTRRFVKVLDDIGMGVRENLDAFAEEEPYPESPTSDILDGKMPMPREPRDIGRVKQHSPVACRRVFDGPRIVNQDHDVHLSEIIRRDWKNTDDREIKLTPPRRQHLNWGQSPPISDSIKAVEERKTNRQERIRSLQRIQIPPSVLKEFAAAGPTSPTPSDSRTSTPRTRAMSDAADTDGGESARGKPSMADRRASVQQGMLARHVARVSHDKARIDSSESSSDSEDRGASLTGAGEYDAGETGEVPQRSATVTQAKYNATMSTQQGRQLKLVRELHETGTDKKPGKKRFSFEAGDDLIGISPGVGSDAYTSYPLPDMGASELGDDLFETSTAVQTTAFDRNTKWELEADLPVPPDRKEKQGYFDGCPDYSRSEVASPIPESTQRVTAAKVSRTGSGNLVTPVKAPGKGRRRKRGSNTTPKTSGAATAAASAAVAAAAAAAAAKTGGSMSSPARAKPGARVSGPCQ